MRTLILNREGQLPKDDWYHLEPSGEHENAAAELVQVIDEAAVEAMVKNFDPGQAGMLIDEEHFSHDPDKSTQAFGWLQEVQNRDGQLYGRIEWTDIGLPAVKNKRLRFFSTEYDPDGVEVIGKGRIRPLRLAGITLTNRPNNKGGQPICNRSGGGDEADAPTQKPTNMKNVATALGLAEDASEGDILAAITKLQNDSKETADKVENMEKEVEEVRNREADDFLKLHAARIGDNEDTIAHFKDGLVKNREATEKVILSLPQAKVEDRTPLHNREKAKAPQVDFGDARKQAAKQRSAIDAIRNRDKCSFDQGFARAQAEHPELFQS